MVSLYEASPSFVLMMHTRYRKQYRPLRLYISVTRSNGPLFSEMMSDDNDDELSRVTNFHWSAPDLQLIGNHLYR